MSSNFSKIGLHYVSLNKMADNRHRGGEGEREKQRRSFIAVWSGLTPLAALAYSRNVWLKKHKNISYIK